MTHLNVESLPEPGDRYILGEEIATGVYAKVYKAIDKESNDKTVAIKIQSFEGDQKYIIDDEYRILRDYSDHPNLPNFFGVYQKKGPECDEIWFILEYCEGGSAIDFVNRLQSVNRRFSEEHIAYILRETITALVQLHKNYFVHRNVRGSNILLTSEGEVKLCDFGLTKSTGSTLGKRSTCCIGSPCWMAPEMFTSSKDEELYGNRVDVWSIGITAIELGDGVAPFLDMHPTRAMFQIVRNPPPTLYRPANWSQSFNDFIAECLEKNPDNRPFMVELLEHPFLTQLVGPNGSDHHLSCEIKHLLTQIKALNSVPKEKISIVNGCIKKYNAPLEKMYVEDLAALDNITEEKILDLLKHRLSRGASYSFIGDVLLSLNSNDMPQQFPRSFHNKYNCKTRSENAPHIFAVADSAYQDMLHHEEPQHIIFAGESYSGKTANLRLAVKHLIILGEDKKSCGDRVIKALDVVHALINASTPTNPDSTRCALQTQLTFGTSGKLSGVIFDVFLLDKIRVSSTDMNQANFHILYYLYDAVCHNNEFEALQLQPGRQYRYLRVDVEKVETKLPYCRYDPEGNVAKFTEFENNLLALDFDADQLSLIRKVLAAILILGNVRFNDDGKFATVENTEDVQKVAKLLDLDEKKFEWSLVNYCLVQSGVAEKRKHTNDEARDARDVLAATIYSRLVDWMINIINQKFALGRAVFGDSNSISLTDMFGFECFNRNRTEQLLINSLNEQMQYHYNQRMFAFEMLEQEEEQIPGASYKYHDNKLAVDHLMTKPYGLFHILDDATRGRMGHDFITDTIANKKSIHVQRVSQHEFSVAHFTGRITYDARDMADKNRDFVPPEMVETLRASKNDVIRILFTNPLTKTGNLTVAYDQQISVIHKSNQKVKWGAALVAEKQTGKKLNTLSHGQYSQIHKMRTMASVFRATCLEILKGLSIGGNSGNTHFVRCIRPSLEYKPREFQSDIVHQQIRALAVLDTAVARQVGFPQRVCFQEFLRRYKFLAFDFDENVDLTKDNCRLLLIRLKMEGWAIGTSKVFLKYYNVEYLSRLYETQVKKIVKVQSMMRAFLAKRNFASKLIKIRQDSIQKEEEKAKKLQRQSSDDDAAITIQKAYRGFKVRQKYGPLLNTKTGEIDLETSKFIRAYAKRWKAKTIFQVLLLYRAARYQDFVNLTQQIHLYNQAVVSALKSVNKCISLDKVDSNESNPALLGPLRPAVNKLPFRLDEIPFFDTSYMCDPITGHVQSVAGEDSDKEEWDAPLKRTTNVSSHIIESTLASSSASLNEYNRILPADEIIHHEAPAVPIKEKVQKNQPPSLLNDRKPSIVRTQSTASHKPVVNENLNSVIGKLNPVKEMQILGRNNSNDDNTEDTPPFNFQGMLRKTEHRRASMKRSKSDSNAGNNNESSSSEHVVYKSEAVAKNKVGSDENDNVPVALPRREVKSMIIPTPNERKMSLNDNVASDSCASLQSIGTYVREELQPGVILEGYAVEL